MTIETVQIDTIYPDPANVRKHPERNLATIKGSLARFGQQRPIVVDQRGIIIAGNGTHAAARELGWTTINIVRTALAGSEATAFSVADNRTSETSEWDHVGLGDILSALRAEDDDLLGAAGFSPDELASLLGTTDEQGNDQPPDQFPEHDEGIDTEHQCPKCSYRWSGSSAPQEVA